MRCPKGHDPDFYRNGLCRSCDRDYQQKHRDRRKTGLALLKTIEKRGMTAREVLQFIANADPVILKHWATMDPWAFGELTRQVEELAATREAGR
ncbi:hypothetical protein [Mycolicibacterium sp. CR10]|uniref:hypothetical protein n=1 Tax=Mycolicibacterium sp. CR10 TaxID=2562314 RepID=UPI0010BFFE26|nr:hypothetical protein [Mycolicibacterium sp. CR10]